MIDKKSKNLKESIRRGVLKEDLDSKLDLVLEGFSALDKKIDDKIDGLSAKMDEKFDEVNVKFDVIFEELHDINGKVDKLEHAVGISS